MKKIITFILVIMSATTFFCQNTQYEVLLSVSISSKNSPYNLVVLNTTSTGVTASLYEMYNSSLNVKRDYIAISIDNENIFNRGNKYIDNGKFTSDGFDLILQNKSKTMLLIDSKLDEYEFDIDRIILSSKLLSEAFDNFRENGFINNSISGNDPPKYTEISITRNGYDSFYCTFDNNAVIKEVWPDNGKAYYQGLNIYDDKDSYLANVNECVLSAIAECKECFYVTYSISKNFILTVRYNFTKNNLFTIFVGKTENIKGVF